MRGRRSGTWEAIAGGEVLVQRTPYGVRLKPFGEFFDRTEGESVRTNVPCDLVAGRDASEDEISALKRSAETLLAEKHESVRRTGRVL